MHVNQQPESSDCVLWWLYSVSVWRSWPIRSTRRHIHLIRYPPSDLPWKYIYIQHHIRCNWYLSVTGEGNRVVYIFHGRIWASHKFCELCLQSARHIICSELELPPRVSNMMNIICCCCFVCWLCAASWSCVTSSLCLFINIYISYTRCDMWAYDIPFWPFPLSAYVL